MEVWYLHCGTCVTLRAVLPRDAALLGSLFVRMSTQSRRNRFHAAVNRVAEGQLQQMSCVDYRQHMALVATIVENGQERVIAEARYVVDASECHTTAQFAIAVDDRWQRHGLGMRAMFALVKAASASGLYSLRGDVLPDNKAMLALMQHCKFVSTPKHGDEHLFCSQITLKRPSSRNTYPWRTCWIGWLHWLKKSRNHVFTQSRGHHAR